MTGDKKPRKVLDVESKTNTRSFFMFSNPASTVNENIAPLSHQSELLEFLYDTDLPDGVDMPLSSISARDSVWDTHRADTLIVEAMYAYEGEFERYSERLGGCSGWLKFGFNELNGLVLKEAFFCRVRYCPVCQWRKTLLWKALMYNSYAGIMEKHPTHRFVFLTLTIKNCAIGDLRETITHMNKSWQRLIKRKEFMGVVDGWIRTTEVTRPKQKRENKKDPIVYCPDTKNTHAHPHFHVILMVKPSYFKGKTYIKQARWVELWGECLRVDYLPVVDVRTVKPKSKGATDDGMKAAIMETLKYAVKPDDIMHDNQDPKAREWFYELTRQTHKLRFVATGGVLKNALKPDDEITNNDLIDTGNDDDETTETDDRRLNFTFYGLAGKYLYNPIHNE